MLGSRRVVVTGIGLVTPLGCGKLNVWDKLVKGETGVRTIEPFHPDIPITVAARVNDFDCEELFGKQSSRYRSLATHFALHASDLALTDAGFNSGADIDLTRAGVAVASGMGSLKDICEGNNLYEASQRKLSPFFVSKILISSLAGEVSIRNGLKGPNHAAATACAASAHAIGDAYNFIRLGYADFMVAGGAEASVDALTIAGFAKMRALTKNTNPATASTPFDEDRNGFVIGEGAGMLVLETLESAKKRDANIIAELVGYGMSGDSHHITSPPEDGNGAYRAMTVALHDAGLSPDNIGYINAHATSTPAGDQAEINAINALFAAPRMPSVGGCVPGDLYVSSTKGATGHLLGAAGAVEAAFTCLAVQEGRIPPTLNLKKPVTPTISNDVIGDCSSNDDREGGAYTGRRCVQHVMGKAYCQEDCGETGGQGLSIAMTNSFGFGGTNASLIFRKFSQDEL